MKLKDKRAIAHVLSRIDDLKKGIFGDHRSLRGSISELRIHYGPGYRIYYTKRQKQIILLLSGGDKDSQKNDIKKAIKIAKQLEKK